MATEHHKPAATWHLKRGSEKKFRAGHPWVFSSELAQSPKGIEPGALVDLRDHSGNFLAIGYGHPNSMISFRTLSLEKGVAIGPEFFEYRFKAAERARRVCGVAEQSHRFVFAEGDFLPGLIIDRFFLETPNDSQVFVIQTPTAGMEKLLPSILGGLEKFINGENRIPFERTAIVVANDSKSRLAEGLLAEPKKLEKTFTGFKPESTRVWIQPSRVDLQPLAFDVDFIGGQKTGFFLDQRSNIELAAKSAQGLIDEAKASGRKIRILDLFCYVGQWGAQLAHLARKSGVETEVTLVDASLKALELAKANVERHGGRATIEKQDVVEELKTFADGAFDIVICDPPAFVKKKKDLPTGSQAYFKINREALRKTAPGGLFVSCSCSGLFGEAEFREMLARVASTSDRKLRWVARGSHSPDHPQRPEFPQGTYLKSWIGILE